jgi:hypothetical protein
MILKKSEFGLGQLLENEVARSAAREIASHGSRPYSGKSTIGLLAVRAQKPANGDAGLYRWALVIYGYLCAVPHDHLGSPEDHVQILVRLRTNRPLLRRSVRFRTDFGLTNRLDRMYDLSPHDLVGGVP